ncbi:MAG TPA: PKD domain-containing protein [Methanoregulaceae archaeon]|nr:PKD domain-containing protein [Methanoregulaceae archaeon]
MKLTMIPVILLISLIFVTACSAQESNKTENISNSQKNMSNITVTNLSENLSIGEPISNISLNSSLINPSDNNSVKGVQWNNTSMNSSQNSSFIVIANETTDNNLSSGFESGLEQSGSSDNYTSPDSSQIIQMPGTETCLTPQMPNIDHTNPGIKNNIIYWIDYGDTVSINVYNLTSGKEIEIPLNGTSLYWYPLIDFSEDKLVYTGDWNGNYSLYIYNISTGYGTRINAGSGVASQFNPSIDANRIVFEDNRDGNNEIFMYDIQTGQETLISSGMSDSIQHTPVIFDSLIAWVSEKDQKFSIYTYNISTKNLNCIVNDTGEFNVVKPSIFNDCVVFEGYKNNKFGIFLYNTTAKQEFNLTNIMMQSDQKNPKIYNDLITFENWENQISSIYIYNTSTGKIFTVPGDIPGSSKINPAIYGNKIVWQDSGTGNSNIYLYTIGKQEVPVIADFTANKTFSQTPITVQFTDKSSGNPSSYFWKFGDETDSAEKNPIHVYTTPGLYTVRLTVSTPWSRDSRYITDYITAGTVPKTSFSATPVSGPQDLEVHFTDTSTGSPDRWHWDFGDSVYSEDQNPVHTYSSPGVFNVMLTAGNQFGNSSVNGSITVLNAINRTISLFNPLVDLYSPDTGFIEINTSSGDYETKLENNNTTVDIVPLDNIQPQMIFFVKEGEEFQIENGKINGNLSKIRVICDDIIIQSGKEADDHNGSANYSFEVPGYVPAASVLTKISEEYTPEEYQNLLTILNNGVYFSANSIDSIAYQVFVTQKNFDTETPGIINMSVNHNWVLNNSQYQDPRRTFVLAMEDANNSFINLDTNFEYENSTEKLDYYMINSSLPINLSKLYVNIYNSSLDLENSRLNLIYPIEPITEPTYTITISIDSDWIKWNKPYKWNNMYEPVAILRIDDTGAGEVLNTTYMGYNPINNTDVFQASSPHGFSTFALVTTSNPGNPLQLLYLSILSRVSPSSAPTSKPKIPQVSYGGGGGGGSYGGSGNIVTSSSSTESTASSSPSTPGEGSTVSQSSPDLGSSAFLGNSAPAPQAAATQGNPALPPAAIAPSQGPGISIFTLFVEAAAAISVILLVVFSIYSRYRKFD